MSVEIEQFKPGGTARPGPRCRYCARLLMTRPERPDEAQTHCDNPMCSWCFECANGKTSVAPWKAAA